MKKEVCRVMVFGPPCRKKPAAQGANGEEENIPDEPGRAVRWR
jgi:hypothetical protein